MSKESQTFIINTVNEHLRLLMAEAQKAPHDMDMQLIVDSAEKLGAAIYALFPEKLKDGKRDSITNAFFNIIDPNLVQQFKAENWKCGFLLGIALRNAQHVLAENVADSGEYFHLLKLTDQYFLGANAFTEWVEMGLGNAFSLKSKNTTNKDEQVIEEIRDALVDKLKVRLHSYPVEEPSENDLDIRKKLIQLCSQFQWKILSAIPEITVNHSVRDLLDRKLDESLVTQYKTELEQYHTLEFLVRTLQNPYLTESEALDIVRSRIAHESDKAVEASVNTERRFSMASQASTLDNVGSNPSISTWRTILKTLQEVLSNLFSAKYFKFFGSAKQAPAEPAAADLQSVISTDNLSEEFMEKAQQTLAHKPVPEPLHEIAH